MFKISLLPILDFGELYHKLRFSNFQSYKEFQNFLVFLILTLFMALRRHPLTNQHSFCILTNHKPPKHILETHELRLHSGKRYSFSFQHFLLRISTHFHKIQTRLMCSSKPIELSTIVSFLFIKDCNCCILFFKLCHLFWKTFYQTETWEISFQLEMQLFLPGTIYILA